MGIILPAAEADNSALLPHALDYARRGWSIIAVVGKKPANFWKPFQSSPADAGTLRRQFAKEGVTGLAVILGAVSGGLAVRDFDYADAYHRWARENPADAAALPTVQTARGFHVYGRLDEERFADFGDGELRADSAHYIVLPPSVHPNGHVYRWNNPLPDVDALLPLLPASLLIQQVQEVNRTHGADVPALPASSSTSSIIAWWKEFSTYILAQTLPTKPGERNRRVFDLAQQIKAVHPDATADDLRPIVRDWHQHALPHTSGEHGFADTWVDFLTAWRRVKRAAGQSFAAAAAAAECGNPPQIAVRYGYDGSLLRLTTLCWHLQQQRGDEPFPLGSDFVGRHLGITGRRASQLLTTLVEDKVLQRISKGTKARNGAPGKASEYRFVAG